MLLDCCDLAPLILAHLDTRSASRLTCVSRACRALVEADLEPRAKAMGVHWLPPGFTWLAAIRESEQTTCGDNLSSESEMIQKLIREDGGQAAGTYGIFEARKARYWFINKIDFDVRTAWVQSHTHYDSGELQLYGGPPYSVILEPKYAYVPRGQNRGPLRALSSDDAIEGPSHLFVPKVSFSRKEPNRGADFAHWNDAIIRPSYHMAQAAEHRTTDIMMPDCARSDLEMLGLHPPRRATHVVSVHYTLQRGFFLPDSALVDRPPLTCAAKLDVICTDVEHGNESDDSEGPGPNDSKVRAVLMYGDHEVCDVNDNWLVGRFYDLRGSEPLIIQKLTLPNRLVDPGSSLSSTI